MKVGWGFTAVAQRVPRLAGLAWFPADWPIQVAVGRRALRLAPPNPLAADLPKSAKQQKPIPPQGASPTVWETNVFIFVRQSSQATTKHPNPQGVSLPAANCGGAERR